MDGVPFSDASNSPEGVKEEEEVAANVLDPFPMYQPQFRPEFFLPVNGEMSGESSFISGSSFTG